MKTYIDSLGRQVSEPVNVSGSETGGLHIGLYRTLRGIDFGLHSDFFLARTVNYVSDLLNDNDTYGAGGGLSAVKYVPDRYSVSVSSTVNYNYTRSSVDPGAAPHFWTQGGNAEFSYFVLPGLEVNTSCNYSWRQKTSVFGNDNATVIWNAFISKNVLDINGRSAGGSIISWIRIQALAGVSTAIQCRKRRRM